MMGVWVAGEALIDLVPANGARIPIVGGGPANTAKALAKLGVSTSFIGGISQDEYGKSIAQELASVDLSLALSSQLPTALAVVSLDETGSASYEFKLEGTATFDFRSEWLPSSSPEVLHIGSLATVIEPGASELFEWARALATTIVLDPNIRPSVINDSQRYRTAVEKWIGISKVVKLSDQDLQWLGYKKPSEILDLGADLVVLTHGPKGISGYRGSGEVSVPAVKVDVVDTVGAGDTVGAVIVEGLIEVGLEQLLKRGLSSTLTRAAKAAAITCSRPGSNPPTSLELL